MRYFFSFVCPTISMLPLSDTPRNITTTIWPLWDGAIASFVVVLVMTNFRGMCVVALARVRGSRINYREMPRAHRAGIELWSIRRTSLGFPFWSLVFGLLFEINAHVQIANDRSLFRAFFMKLLSLAWNQYIYHSKSKLSFSKSKFSLWTEINYFRGEYVLTQWSVFIFQLKSSDTDSGLKRRHFKRNWSTGEFRCTGPACINV